MATRVEERDIELKDSVRAIIGELFTLDTEELTYLLLGGTPEGVFRALALEEEASGKEHFFPTEVATYSSLQPHVYLASGARDLEAVVQVTQSLWALTQELYQDAYQDTADLSAWAAEDFPFVLKRVTPTHKLTLPLKSPVFFPAGIKKPLAFATFIAL